MKSLDSIIEKATIKDIQGLNSLINGAYRGEQSKKGWTTEADLLGGIRIDDQGIEEIITNPKATLLIYKAENELIGCVNLEKRGKNLYLGMLTVKPTMQAYGIGKQLLKKSEEYAFLMGCEFIEMTVISKRIELIDWYKRNGYIETGEMRPFPMNDPRFGNPKTDLEFLVLKKQIINNQ